MYTHTFSHTYKPIASFSFKIKLLYCRVLSLQLTSRDITLKNRSEL